MLRAATDLAPETSMWGLSEGQLPLEAWLTETLTQGDSKAVHAACGGGDLCESL